LEKFPNGSKNPEGESMKIKDYIQLEITEIRRIIDSPIHPPGRVKIIRLQGMLEAYQNIITFIEKENENG
jgi:hypothetical protein